MNTHTHTEPADEFDCPLCRVRLLEAFREPVGTDGAPTNAGPVDTPHLMVPDSFTRTVDMRPPEASPHVVWSRTDPGLNPQSTKGIWIAGCSCGWRRSGAYTKSGAYEIVARRLAETWAARHLENPLEGTEDS